MRTEDNTPVDTAPSSHTPRKAVKRSDLIEGQVYYTAPITGTLLTLAYKDESRLYFTTESDSYIKDEGGHVSF